MAPFTSIQSAYFLSFSVFFASAVELTDKRGEKGSDGENAWSSIIHNYSLYAPPFNSVYVRPSYTTVEPYIYPLFFIRHHPSRSPSEPHLTIYIDLCWFQIKDHQSAFLSPPFLVCDAWPLFSRNRPKFNPASILLTPSPV
jgi:hypothetical protein